MSWKPINTAPKETEIWVGKWVNNEWRTCQSGLYFDQGRDDEGPPYWFWASDWDMGGVTDNEGPSHWMEIPPPPPKEEMQYG